MGGDDHFEVMLADSPWELESILRGKIAEGYSARCRLDSAGLGAIRTAMDDW